MKLPPANNTFFNMHSKGLHFNPFDINKDDPASVLCLAPLALEQYLWGILGEKDANNNKETCLNKWQVKLQLIKVWCYVMIYCSISLWMPFHHSPWISDSIPPCIWQTFELHFYPCEQEQYILWSWKIAYWMVRKLLDHWLVWNMVKLQELMLVMTWLWFRHVHNDMKSTNAWIMAIQTKNWTLAKQWIVQVIKKENKLFNQQEWAK